MATSLGPTVVADGAVCRWGQVYLLEALVYYVPADSQEAEMIAERIAPRLMHANSAVALAAIRVRAKAAKKKGGP